MPGDALPSYAPPNTRQPIYVCLCWPRARPWGCCISRTSATYTRERAEPLQTLAVTVGDHISLALANIRLRETLRHQVVHDVLTGLFNRRYLEETLEREIYRGRRKGASLGLIMLDLDYFKHFNDTYGHEAGDNLLRTLGKFLAVARAPGRRGLPLWGRRICLDPGGSLSGDCLTTGRGHQAGISEAPGSASGPGAGERHGVSGSGHVPGARRHRPGRAPGRRRRHVPGQGPRPQPGGGGREQGACAPDNLPKPDLLKISASHALP